MLTFITKDDLRRSPSSASRLKSRKRQLRKRHASRNGRRTVRRETLPEWSDLHADDPFMRREQTSTLSKISTLKFFLLVGALAAAATLYVGHVQATQNVLAELQQAQKENLQLHLKHNRLKGSFDAQTSPAVIYRRAGTLGLRQGASYGPTITVPPHE